MTRAVEGNPALPSVKQKVTWGQKPGATIFLQGFPMDPMREHIVCSLSLRVGYHMPRVPDSGEGEPLIHLNVASHLTCTIAPSFHGLHIAPSFDGPHTTLIKAQLCLEVCRS